MSKAAQNEKQSQSRYGHFSSDDLEYIVTHPKTPRPWRNWLHNPVYLVCLTQHATGASYHHSGNDSLRVALTGDDDGGGPRFVYLRDNHSETYWSLTGAPEVRPMEGWQCRVGLGYQVNTSRFNGIEGVWRIFVPPTDDPVEIWNLAISNTSGKNRSLSLFPYLEMHLGPPGSACESVAALDGRYDERQRAVVGVSRSDRLPVPVGAFLACDGPVAAATVSRDEFLGPYRDYAHPLAVEKGNVHNTEAAVEPLGASLRHDVELQPGQTAILNCLIAVSAPPDSAEHLLGKYLAEGRPEGYFRELTARAGRASPAIRVETPDAQFDRWSNVWLPRGLEVATARGRLTGRTLRDTLQLSNGHRLLAPAAARAMIKEALAHQYADGRCVRAWHRPTGQLDLREHADSPVWIVVGLAHYLRETADWSLLDEEVPFLNQDNPGAPPTGGASVWDHAVLAQHYLLSQTGGHGLCRIGAGDWCNSMTGAGAAGRGESVVLSMQAQWGCVLLAELAERRGQPDLAAALQDKAAELRAAIDERAWDGRWYLRAFDDEGRPVGSRHPSPQNEGEGAIFLLPQAWALLTGMGSDERRKSLVGHTIRELDGGYGCTLSAPAFRKMKPHLGQVTALAPGFFENGSVHVEANALWAYGLLRAGFGEEAFQAFQAVLPDSRNKPLSDVEPFLIPEFYIGPDCERRAQKTIRLPAWHNSATAWLLTFCLEGVLGVRADYDGLRIEPVLPPQWAGAAVSRPFRGDVYDVKLHRSRKRAATVETVRLDDAPLEGNLVPPVGDGGRHRVEVVLA